MALEMRPIKHWQSVSTLQTWDSSPEPSFLGICGVGRALGGRGRTEPCQSECIPFSYTLREPPISLEINAVTTQNE